MLFNKGDKVRLKSLYIDDFSDERRFPNNPHFDEEMAKYMGIELTVTEKVLNHGENECFIEEDGGDFYWDMRWFEPLRNLKAKPVTYEELLKG